MASEQQFCLRWNNHQSTLVAVFDTLLESGTLVDCTLAAEGQYLKAHKVVLSACSPYFELLLSQHYEKHPIIILKDVKFQELKAMMDYMYRGEVNISQDQLGALLKAAESLQIKGLSEGGGGTDREPEPKRHDRRKEMVQPSAPRTPPILPHSSSGLTIEHRRSIPSQADPQVVDLPEDSPPPISHSKLSVSRDGSISPVPRKRKKHRRRSSGDEASLGVPGVLPMTDNHETNSSCELPTQTQQTSIPATITPVVPNPMSKMDPLSHSVEDKNNEPDIMSRPLVPTQVAVPSPQALPLPLGEPESAVHKVEPPSEMMLEPKSEYLEEDINEDSVEDLTLDDDMDDLDQSRPGPSHGGESSSAQGTGFAPWHVASDRSTDEVFMAAQEAVGAHRDSQGSSTRSFATSFSEIKQINLCPRQPDNIHGVCSTTLNLNTRVEQSTSSRNVTNGVISFSDKTVQGERSYNVFDWINQSETDATSTEYSSIYVQDKLPNYPLESNLQLYHKHNISGAGNTSFIDFDKSYEFNSVYGETLACPSKNSEGNRATTPKKHSAKKSQKQIAGISSNKYKYSCMFCKSNFRTLSENILHQSTCRSKSESTSNNSMVSKTGYFEESFDENVSKDLAPEFPTKHLLVVLNTKVPCLQCNKFFNNNRLLMNHLLTCKSEKNSSPNTVSNIDRKTL